MTESDHPIGELLAEALKRVKAGLDGADFNSTHVYSGHRIAVADLRTILEAWSHRALPGTREGASQSHRCGEASADAEVFAGRSAEPSEAAARLHCFADRLGRADRTLIFRNANGSTSGVNELALKGDLLDFLGAPHSDTDGEAALWRNHDVRMALRAATASPESLGVSQDEPPSTPPPAVSEDWKPTHRHVKRGTEYQVLGWGRVQCSESGLLDNEHVMIYRGDDGSLWARRHAEFIDGRFASLTPAPVRGDDSSVADISGDGPRAASDGQRKSEGGAS